MEYTIEGTLKTASKPETIKTKNGDKQKRTFVIETNEEYKQLLQFELFGDKAGAITGMRAGDFVKIKFEIRGREWTKPETQKTMYFTSLSARSVEKVDLEGGDEEAVDVPDEVVSINTDELEELPF